MGGVGGGDNVYVARAGARWQRRRPRPQAAQAPQRNIFRERPGPNGVQARAATTPLDAFNLYMTDAMVHIVVVHTNEEGVRVTAEYNAQNPGGLAKQFRQTTPTEIRAFIGLFIIRGVYRDYGIPRQDLWSEQHGRPVYTATMSVTRFRFLMRILRFDDKATRDARVNDDKFAAIRHLFNMFNEECARHFTLSENVTIDETLRRFRGRCSFRCYMPAKPGKYGILFRVLSDAENRLVNHLRCINSNISNN